MWYFQMNDNLLSLHPYLIISLFLCRLFFSSDTDQPDWRPSRVLPGLHLYRCRLLYPGQPDQQEPQCQGLSQSMLPHPNPGTGEI